MFRHARGSRYLNFSRDDDKAGGRGSGLRGLDRIGKGGFPEPCDDHCGCPSTSRACDCQLPERATLVLCLCKGTDPTDDPFHSSPLHATCPLRNVKKARIRALRVGIWRRNPGYQSMRRRRIILLQVRTPALKFMYTLLTLRPRRAETQTGHPRRLR